MMQKLLAVYLHMCMIHLRLWLRQAESLDSLEFGDAVCYASRTEDRVR